MPIIRLFIEKELAFPLSVLRLTREQPRYGLRYFQHVAWLLQKHISTSLSRFPFNITGREHDDRRLLPVRKRPRLMCQLHPICIR